MDDVLARHWGWITLRGALALLFGLFTLFNPGVTLTALVLLFGAYVIADGVFKIISALSNRGERSHWVMVLLGGLVGIAAGIVTFLMPGVTLTVLILVLAGWAIVTGILEIVAAIRLRKVIAGEWLLGLSGVLSIIFGVLIVAVPAAGALTVALWVGAYATLLGILLIALSLRLRSWQRGDSTLTM